jgi:hypothetical protein
MSGPGTERLPGPRRHHDTRNPFEPWDKLGPYDIYDGLNKQEYWMNQIADSVGMDKDKERTRILPLGSRVPYPHVVQWLWLLVQTECDVKDEAGEDYMFFKSMIQVHI